MSFCQLPVEPALPLQVCSCLLILLRQLLLALLSGKLWEWLLGEEGMSGHDREAV